MLTIHDEVKELLKSDSVKKNFRISFPNGERDDIINDNLIQDSVSFTESVCSQNTLKFGLAEASTLSFQTVGIENIKGCIIDARLEVDMTSLKDKYVAYESYTFPGTDNEYTFNVVSDLYISYTGPETSSNYTFRYSIIGYTESSYTSTYEGYIAINDVKKLGVEKVSELIGEPDIIQARITLSLYNFDHSQTYNVSFFMRGAAISTEVSDLDYEIYPIPYGRFVVDSCKKTGEFNQRQIECYSYDQVGFSELYKNIMNSFSCGTETYTVNQPAVLLASYLYKDEIQDDFLGGGSIIEPESASFTYDDLDALLSDTTSGTLNITTRSTCSQRYNLKQAFTTDNYLVHYQIVKKSNYDELFETAIEEIMQGFEDNDLEDFIKTSGSGSRIRPKYTSQEEAVRDILTTMLKLGAYCENITDGTVHQYSANIPPSKIPIDVESNFIYSQKTTIADSSSSDEYLPAAYIYVPDSITIYFIISDRTPTVRFSVTINEPLYRVVEIRDYYITSSFANKYADWNISIENTSTFVSSTTGKTVYAYDNISELEDFMNGLIELDANFYHCGRGNGYIQALSNEITETIDASLYTSLWFDENEISVTGVKYPYLYNDTLETEYFGIEPLYSLTDNLPLQQVVGASNVYDIINDDFWPNAEVANYVPYTLTCIGLPYLEAGDYITVQDKEGNEFNTYIMRQTISGIQHLTSSMEAQSVDV